MDSNFVLRHSFVLGSFVIRASQEGLAPTCCTGERISLALARSCVRLRAPIFEKDNAMGQWLVKSSTFFWYTWVLVVCGMHGRLAETARAADRAPGGSREEQLSTDSGEALNVEADRIEYEGDGRIAVFRGNVRIDHGGDILTADFLRYDTQTGDIFASGNVESNLGGKQWSGQELQYNIKTKAFVTETFTAFIDPYYVEAEQSHSISENEVKLEDVVLSTCDPENREVKIRARDVRIIDGRLIKARGVFFYLQEAPFLYVPYWRHKAGEKSNLDLVPGYSSRMGAFLLSAYNYPVSDHLRAATHLDYRSKRGIGLGHDFVWENKQERYQGRVTGYYLDDDSPHEGDDPTPEELDLIDNERYRLRLQHAHMIQPRDYFLADISYLSDPDIVEDFFDEEFREAPQPENRVSLVHRGDHFTAGVLINKRLNDFYNNIDRLPEFSLDMHRQALGRSGLYYESENRATFLEAVFSEHSDREDYDTFRVDSLHRVLYPTRHFGFLNLIPRAGYRGTYYSDTQQETAEFVLSTVTDTNGITRIETNRISRLVDLGSDFRNILELGLETSFKAFKTWDSSWFHGDLGTRHVVEPFANYTYIPEPNLLPEELPQFDSVDRLDERHDIRFGVRNKFQTKRRGRIRDLLDLEVFTVYDVNAEGEEEDFSDIFFDGELRLVDWIAMDFDGRFDHTESELRRFSTQVSLRASDDSSLAIEYRFRPDEQSLLAGELELFPNNRWSFATYHRYEFETGELEEQSFMVVRKTSCLGLGLGVKEVDDDVTAWGQLWLTAFPETAVSLGR